MSIDEKNKPKICLWCGGFYEQGMEGICRGCWEENQFKDTKEKETEKGLL